MAKWIGLILSQALGLNIACNLNECLPYNQGNGECNLKCMSSSCNYDTGGIYKDSSNVIGSDCLDDCFWGNWWGCYISILGDGNCDEACNIPECGYDFGDCGYCAPSCNYYLGYKSKLGGSCDFECNTTACYYDAGACLECASGCSSDIWGNGVCNEECNNKECNYDNGDCWNVTCAPNCYIWMKDNGICDEACHVEECNFDDFDCDCSPGCFSSLLGNGECNEICNSLRCEFDRGDCGYCASGCYLDMLNNDVCDDNCNNLGCKYDNYVCGCSPSCRPEDYGKCKPECLVSSCFYDQVAKSDGKWCDDKDLVMFTVFQHIILNDTERIVRFDDCLAASNNDCTFSKYSDPDISYSECLYRQCNYGLTINKRENCNLIVPIQDAYICHSCYSYWCFPCNDCLIINYYNYITIPLFDMELRKVPNYVRIVGYKDFFIFHATSIQSGLAPSGDGRLASPFETIEFALQSIYELEKEINILFLANDGNYTLSDCNIIGWINDLWITSYDSNKVIIKINGWSEVSCQHYNGNFKLENLIFDGSEQYAACNDSIYCEYCAYSFYNESDEYYYNDRIQPISKNLPIDKCVEDRSGHLTLFQNYGIFTVLNTEIRNIRFNYDSIFSKSSGELNLFNVSFDNIRLRSKEAAAVIYLSDKINFNYIGGSVTRLNNGYEIGDPMDFRGFLYVANKSSTLIKNVDFKYNLVYKKPHSSLLSASLIFISVSAEVEIDNCTFMYNYCKDGLVYSNTKIIAYDSSYNETYYMISLTRTFLYVHDTNFISNYGNFGVIHISFLGKLLNVHLRNLTIESNGAENDSLIYLSNPQIYDDYKTQTTSTLIISTVKTVSVIMSPRWCKITSIYFKNNHAKGMLNAINMVNFELKNLTIDSNGSPVEDKNINTLVLNYFIENRHIENLYLSKTKANPQVLDCDSMVSLSNPYKLDMKILNISNNICRNSSPTFKVENSDIRDLTSINCFGNIGNGPLSVCFYISGLYDRNITNSYFVRNINHEASGFGALQIDSENDLYIINCKFLNNSAGSSSALYFSGHSIYIDSSTFELNESKQGNGGGLYFISIPSSTKGSIIITSSSFNLNSAYMFGGAAYIEEKSTSPLSLELVISLTNFTGNSANYGSALYIDKTVALVESSTIIATNFTENNSFESGTVALLFSSGILSFKSCEFIENDSIYGAAIYIDITQDKNNLRSKVIIELSTLRNNRGNSVIFGDNQNRNSSIETKSCLFEHNKGIVASLNYDYFIDNGSIFRYNSAPFGSCFYLQNSAILYATSQFINNTSDDYGGVIAINFKSVFNCDNCTFIQNRALSGKGGVLDSDQDSLFFISNSNFLQNSCGSDGSAIFIFNCNSTASSIVASNFSTNNANGAGVITLISSKLLISSSNVNSNSAKGHVSGVKLSFSIAEINDSNFANQSSIYGNFIYLQAASSINLRNTTFYKGNSNDSGGAIYSSSSLISVDSCIFDNLLSPKGGAIYATFDSTIIVNNSDFKHLSSSTAGGIINANQANLIIENSNFREFSLTGIYGRQLKYLEISNSSFTNGLGRMGGAISCQACSKVNIKLCTFMDNSASLYGGALYLDSSSEFADFYNIFSCRFINNIAENGGAILGSDVNLNISSSVFKQNKATIEFDHAKIEYGIGGGIKVSCPNIESCKFKIQSNGFVENYAKYNGGALSWDNKLPEFFNNSYQYNTALYGKDIASFPVKLMRVNESGILENYGNRRLAGPVSSSNLTGVASGQSYKNQLCVALVDDMDNIIRTDNSSEAELKSVNSITKISGKIKVRAENGVFNFSEFVISEEPGSDIQLAVISSAIDAAKIKLSGQKFYSQSLTFNVNVRKCELGEVTSGKNCQVCPEGFYSLNPDLISCLACPETAKCYGNYTMVPKPGYWRDNLYTDKFWKCPHSSACLGSPNKNSLSYTGECGIAYKGNKCQACKSGYSHTMDNKCEECPSVTVNIVTTAGVSLALIILLFILVKATRKSAFRPKSHLSIYIKIFLNYIQMVILASTFKLSWSDEVLGLFKVQNNADYVYQQIYSFQCLLNSEKSQSLVYFRILIIVGLIPVLIIIMSFLFWTIVKLLKRSYKTFFDDFISTCIILLFLIHPSIVKKMFSSMNCSEINSGEYWIEEDLDIRCWDYDHVFYVLTVSLPSIVLWGIILPTVCLANMIKNRKSLNEISIRLRFGFLFNGYREEHFYWEFIILYSKIILICCSIFLTRISIKLQALIVTILYSIYLRIQYSNNPYSEYKLNQMELRAKLVCAVTIYCGLYYLMGSLSTPASIFFFIVIAIANIYFLVYWAYYLLKSLFSAIFKKVGNLRTRRKVQSQSAVRSLRSSLEESRLVSRSVNLSIISNDNLLSESQAPVSTAKNDKENFEESSKIISV